MGGTTIGGGSPSHNTPARGVNTVDQNQFDEHCKNVEDAIAAAEEDKVKAMPKDVIALCDACSESDPPQEDINKVRAIKTAAGHPHSPDFPVNLATADAQFLLTKAKSDFEEKVRLENDPSLRPMFDPLTGRPIPAQVGRGRDVPTPGPAEKFSKGPAGASGGEGEGSPKIHAAPAAKPQAHRGLPPTK